MSRTPAPEVGSVPAFRYGAADPGSAFDLPRTRSPGRTVAIDRLAVYFSLVGLTRDVHPISPWHGQDEPRPAPARPAGTSNVDEFTERFRAAVGRAVEGHEVVAVSMSGGMDSAALIAAADRICRRNGQRLVAVTLDIEDDGYRGTGVMVERMLRYLGVTAEVVRVAARPGRWPDAAWNPAGPRFDAWPRYHVGVAASAIDRGATVLLQGTGADQLLQTPPHLVPELIRSRRWAAIAAYRRDQPEGAAVVTALAATGRISTPRSARLYWATAWPGFTTDRGAPVLGDRCGVAARRWIADFERECVRVTAEAAPTWAEATLMHRFFPFDLLDPVLPVAESMPFLDPDFAAYCYDLPLAARYSAELPNAYVRSKALVAQLLPSGVESLLAPRRQRFYQAYRRYWQFVLREPRLGIDTGLVRPDWRRHVRDAFDVAMLMNCEDWLQGAVASGADVAS